MDHVGPYLPVVFGFIALVERLLPLESDQSGYMYMLGMRHCFNFHVDDHLHLLDLTFIPFVSFSIGLGSFLSNYPVRDILRDFLHAARQSLLQSWRWMLETEQNRRVEGARHRAELGTLAS